jgi:hypothetical protein
MAKMPVFAGVVAVVCHLGLAAAAVTLRLEAVSGMERVVEGDVWHARVSAAAGSTGLPLRVYPFLDLRQWGARVTLSRAGEWVNMTLPMPSVGERSVLVGNRRPGGDFTVGLPVPIDALLSNNVTVKVVPGPRLPPGRPSKTKGTTQLLMEWEPWFTPLNNRWEMAEAVPLVGWYDSFNPMVARQHALWLAHAGVTGIVVDWTNNIWGIDSWDKRPPGATQLIDATLATLEVYKEMKGEGLEVPSMMLLLGLDNGPVAKTSVLNEEIDFIRRNVSSRYADLLFQINGRPALGIFDAGNIHDDQSPPVNTSGFTVRWWASQFQATHLNEKGFWSWMDGTIEPLPTKGDSGVEVVTLTNAFFGDRGWLFAPSLGQLGGSVLLREWAQVMRYSPEFSVLCQWNEFLGQSQGHGYGPNHDRYVDIYNVSFSNDMEPVSLTELGYRSAAPGWGLFYVNLLRALHDISDLPHLGSRILLTVASPTRWETLTGATTFVCSWHAMDSYGRVDTAEYDFEVSVAGRVVARTRSFSATIDVTGMPKGDHTLTVAAKGLVTSYPLSYDRVDDVPTSGSPLEVHVPVRI